MLALMWGPNCLKATVVLGAELSWLIRKDEPGSSASLLVSLAFFVVKLLAHRDDLAELNFSLDGAFNISRAGLDGGQGMLSC